MVPTPNARRLALVLACLVLVVLLALQVWREGPMTRIDLAITHWLAAHRIGPLTAFMLLVSEVHQTKWLLLATACVAAWQARQRHWTQLAQLAVVPTAMLVNAGLKLVFHRPRPVLEAPLLVLMTLSFPSGHAVASTAFYGVLCALAFGRWPARRARALAVALAAIMVLLVTFSRVYLGAHYFSDVVAGVAVGAVCLALFLAPWRGARAPRSQPATQ